MTDTSGYVAETTKTPCQHLRLMAHSATSLEIVYCLDCTKRVDIKVHAWCHLCNPIRAFRSIIDLQTHTRNDHRVWKG